MEPKSSTPVVMRWTPSNKFMMFNQSSNSDQKSSSECVKAPKVVNIPAFSTKASLELQDQKDLSI